MTAKTTWRNRIVGHGEEAPDQLLANPANWRVHPKQQQDALAGVLDDVGWVQDIIVNRRSGHVVDGHLRVSLAISRNEPSVPVVYVDLDEREEALVLATIDPLSAMAATDKEQLDSLLRDVATGEAAVQAMLSELAEKNGLMDLAGMDGGRPTEPEKPLAIEQLDELARKWGVQAGQLWTIKGKACHRLVCGSSDDPATVERVLAGASGLGLVYDPDWDTQPAFVPDGYEAMIAFTDGNRAGDVVRRFGPPTWVFTWDGVTSWYTPNRPLKRGKYAFWYGDVEAFDADGAHYGEPDKAHEVSNTRGSYEYKPDPRGKHLSDVFQLPLTKLHSNGLHPYEKPLDWVRLLIGDCLPKAGVLDPFLGSGASMAACEQLGRPCFGVEIEPGYVALALERLTALGAQAELSE